MTGEDETNQDGTLIFKPPLLLADCAVDDLRYIGGGTLGLSSSIIGFINGDLSKDESAYEGGPLSRSEPDEMVGDKPSPRALLLFDMSGDGDRNGDGLRTGEGCLFGERQSILSVSMKR